MTTKIALPLTVNALRVLEKRYLHKDEKGRIIETPEELFQRVAKNIASADTLYGEDEKRTGEEFLEVLTSLEFLPNSPTLMNAGRELQQLSACFVIPVGDSMDSIFDAVKATALIHKSGGGTGFSFSRLRPKGDVVLSTGGVSSGPVSFMRVFNAATEAVKQGGTRRGANMGILKVDHPDIEEFIACKENENECVNFNLSVALTEKFMSQVEKNEDYELINPRTKEVEKKLNAKAIFNKIVERAWENGEPGVIFIDRINASNPTPQIGEIESTNPCGEQPLLPYESCNLGSINLVKMVTNGREKQINWEKLAYVTRIAVHFLDNVIDLNRYPLEKIREMTLANRKIGLGIMGWADFLAHLGISYNSAEALNLAEKVMSLIREEAIKESEELARRRGAFPNFNRSIYANATPLRNATLTTIAPTGTIGIIAGASSGIEPFYALVYVRANVLDNDQLLELNPHFAQVAKERGFYSPELIKKIAEKGSIKEMKEIPEDVRNIFVTAYDIPPEMHIRMQSAFQKYVDNAVSKTVNFPNSAKPEDIAKVYLLAHKSGCKGVTVYRDGSRSKQVLNIGKSGGKKEVDTSEVDTSKEKIARLRPQVTTGLTAKMRTGCGNMYVTVNEDEQGPCEIFTLLGKSGGCTASQSEAIGRLVSLALRSGLKCEEIIQQLKGIRCPQPAITEQGVILSCADALAKAMENYLKEKKMPTLFELKDNPQDNHPQDNHPIAGGANSELNLKSGSKFDLSKLGICPQCPDCGNTLSYEEGCIICHSCGYSKCG